MPSLPIWNRWKSLPGWSHFIASDEKAPVSHSERCADSQKKVNWGKREREIFSFSKAHKWWGEKQKWLEISRLEGVDWIQHTQSGWVYCATSLRNCCCTTPKSKQYFWIEGEVETLEAAWNWVRPLIPLPQYCPHWLAFQPGTVPRPTWRCQNLNLWPSAGKAGALAFSNGSLPGICLLMPLCWQAA